MCFDIVFVSEHWQSTFFPSFFVCFNNLCGVLLSLFLVVCVCVCVCACVCVCVCVCVKKLITRKNPFYYSFVNEMVTKYV